MSSTEQILEEARAQLQEREGLLDALILETQSELEHVRAALQKLGGKATPPKPKKAASANGNGSKPTPRRSPSAAIPSNEKIKRMRAWLDERADGEPQSIAAIADGIVCDGRGLHQLLCRMKKRGEVAEPEDNLWLSTKAPRFDTGRRDKVPDA